MIIDFSGTDGTGKTTAYNYFCDQLEARGKRVLRTREVGSPLIPVCVELRKTILDPKYKMDGRAMELVFAAMRIENARVYEEAQKTHDYIVSDRGWLCHLAYTDHNVSPEFSERLYLDFLEDLTYLPDRAYLFHVDSDTAATRRSLRAEVVDAIEAKGDAFQRAVAQSYQRYAETFRDDFPVVLVSTAGSVEDVREIMDREIDLLLG